MPSFEQSAPPTSGDVQDEIRDSMSVLSEDTPEVKEIPDGEEANDDAPLPPETTDKEDEKDEEEKEEPETPEEPEKESKAEVKPLYRRPTVKEVTTKYPNFFKEF